MKFKQERAETNLAQLAELKRNVEEADDDDDEIVFLNERRAKKVRSIGPVIDLDD